MHTPVILITGALTGIGRATALAFARDGVGAHFIPQRVSHAESQEDIHSVAQCAPG